MKFKFVLINERSHSGKKKICEIKSQSILEKKITLETVKVSALDKGFSAGGESRRIGA